MRREAFRHRSHRARYARVTAAARATPQAPRRASRDQPAHETRASPQTAARTYPRRRDRAGMPQALAPAHAAAAHAARRGRTERAGFAGILPLPLVTLIR